MLTDPIKTHIFNNSSAYFPSEDFSNCIVRDAASLPSATNPVYLFEVSSPRHDVTKRIIAKVIPAEESLHGYAQEYGMLKRLHGQAALAHKGFSVPRPLDYIEELRTVLMEEISGDKLSRIIKERNRIWSSHSDIHDIESALTRAGCFLRTMHDLTSTGQYVQMPEKLINKIADRCEFLANRNILHRNEIGQVEKILRKLCGHSDETKYQLVIQHGDYHLGNILLNGSEMIVIDFTFSSPYPVFNDISQLLMSLELINPLPNNIFYDFRNISLFKKLFLQGYWGDLSVVNDSDWFMVHLHKLRNILIKFGSLTERSYNSKKTSVIFGVNWFMKRRLLKILSDINRFL